MEALLKPISPSRGLKIPEAELFIIQQIPMLASVK
jgi:hypothetical protein